MTCKILHTNQVVHVFFNGPVDVSVYRHLSHTHDSAPSPALTFPYTFKCRDQNVFELYRGPLGQHGPYIFTSWSSCHT